MSNFLSPIGAAFPKVLVIVDTPDLIERSKGTFTSNANKLLKSLVQAADLPAHICQFRYFINNPFITPEQLMDKGTQKRAPILTEIGQNIAEALRNDIMELKPALIICAGPITQLALTGRVGVDKWRGSILSPVWQSEDTPKAEMSWVLPVLPPARCMFSGSHARYLTIQDIRKVVRFLDNGANFTQRNIITAPSFADTIDYLQTMYERGQRGSIVYFDIECKNLELQCIGFGTTHTEAMCIPLHTTRGAYYKEENEVKVMQLISRILTDPAIRKCGQNIIFDTHFLLRKYGIRCHSLDDTMIAQHTLFHELPKSLDMLTSLYTDIPYYKEDGKQWFKTGGLDETLWRYNCLDVLSCAEVFPTQLEILANTDKMNIYESQRALIEPCTYMMERGIAVDIKIRDEFIAKYQHELTNLRTQWVQAAPDVNPASPKQLMEYFYGTLGYPPQKGKKKTDATDEVAMKRLITLGCDEAQLLLEIRKREKIVSTYFKPSKYDADDRIRCQYKPVGTSYSRLASSESFFGTGMNMQNWPHSALACLKPDEGYVFYSFDYSQAENRIVAYVGKIGPMIEAFETGKDVHRLTASLIFQKKPEDISSEKGSSTIGGGAHSERDWGKRANHGLNYDFAASSFALLYEIPIAEANRIYNGYHAAYPGVKQGFHAYVKKCLNDNRQIVNLMGRRSTFLSRLDDTTFKAAYSCIPQGTVGDMMNTYGLNYIYYNQHLFRPIELLNQVHDSLGFQIPLSVPWSEHATMLQLIKDSFETPVTTHYGREFVIPADLCMSLSLRKEDGEELKAKNWPSTVEELAKKLEETHGKLSAKCS